MAPKGKNNKEEQQEASRIGSAYQHPITLRAL